MKRSAYLQQFKIHDRLGLYLEELHNLSQGTGEENTGINLLRQYNGLKREVLGGVVDEEYRNLWKNRLFTSGLKLQKELQEEMPHRFEEEVATVDVEQMEEDPVIASAASRQSPTVEQHIYHVETLNQNTGTQYNIKEIKDSSGFQVGGEDNTIENTQRVEASQAEQEQDSTLALLFDIPYNRVEQWTPQDPEDPGIHQHEVKALVERIEVEFGKGPKASKNTLKRLLGDLADYAPEVLEAITLLMDHPKVDLPPSVRELGKSFETE